MSNPHGTRLSLPVVYTDTARTYAAVITGLNTESVDLLVFPPAGTGEGPMEVANVAFSAQLEPNRWSFA